MSEQSKEIEKITLDEFQKLNMPNDPVKSGKGVQIERSELMKRVYKLFKKYKLG